MRGSVILFSLVLAGCVRTMAAETPPPIPNNDVVTHHYDAMRTGLNSHELILTPANVTPATFGKVGELAIDSRIDGQVLYLGQLAIPGKGTKNVLYFATETDTVYAVDADSISGSSATILWKTPALGTGEMAVPLASLPCGNIDPNGITATPVIDRARDAIYVVAFSTDGKGHFFHRLHALDLATGNELFGGPVAIEGSYPGSGGTVSFLPFVQAERAALLESRGKIYLSWAGRLGDCGAYAAWVMAYDAGTLAQTSVIDLIPNGRGAGIWMGGGGPASDASGDIYLATSNALGRSVPGLDQNYGESFVRLSGANLSVVDYFAPSNATFLDNSDLDLGSSGPLLLPDLLDGNNVRRRLAVVAGKDGVVYVVDRDHLGRYDAAQNNAYQQLPSDGQPNFSSPAWFNGTVFIGPANLSLRAYSISRALLSASPSSQTAHHFGANGTVPSISSNGNSDGIVWALDYGPGILFAYDATDLTKTLYDSTQAPGGRDRFSTVAGHFITPVVTNGRVYFGTGSTVAVFGLLGR